MEECTWSEEDTKAQSPTAGEVKEEREIEEEPYVKEETKDRVKKEVVEREAGEDGKKNKPRTKT